MTSPSFPPADTTCPHPPGCPVPAGIEHSDFSAHTLPAGTEVFRCYDSSRGYDTDNPGYGDTRFQPFDAADGRRVSSMYLAENESAALLETVFHEVHHDADRRVYQSSLLQRLLVRLRVPVDLHLIDLRDQELSRLGISRAALVATSAEHYPCTRRIAAALHARTIGGAAPDGLLWHSRQAELVGGQTQAAIVFTDRVRAGSGTWPLARPGVRALFEGSGRELVDRIAEDLDAVVVLD